MAVMSIADALKSAIAEEMRRDPTVFCIGEDEDIPGGMGGAFTVTKGLADEFGANVRSADDKGFGGTPVPIGEARVINTPIAEIMISGVCVGAAMAGMRPVADLQYGDFLFCMPRCAICPTVRCLCRWSCGPPAAPPTAVPSTPKAWRAILLMCPD